MIGEDGLDGKVSLIDDADLVRKIPVISDYDRIMCFLFEKEITRVWRRTISQFNYMSAVGDAGSINDIRRYRRIRSASQCSGMSRVVRVDGTSDSRRSHRR